MISLILLIVFAVGGLGLIYFDYKRQEKRLGLSSEPWEPKIVQFDYQSGVSRGRQDARDEIAQLQRKLKELKIQIRIKDEALRQKNLELDSMFYVWCTGACKGGIQRFVEGPPLSEELVQTAERNVKRLRTRWDNDRFKYIFDNAWKHLTLEERNIIREDWNLK